MTKQPDYVREFHRWLDMSPGGREWLVTDQAARGVTGAKIEIDSPMDTITECGKALGECTADDLKAIATWGRELAAAYGARASMFDAEIKRRGAA
jgi:hypothetical protein